MVRMVQGLKHLGLDTTLQQAFSYSLGMIATLATVIGIVVVQRVRHTDALERQEFMSLERVFAVLMVFTACSMAFAHGSNDVSNAVGPLAAVFSTLSSGGGNITQKMAMPSWLLLIGGAGIVTSVLVFGYRVMRTISTQITGLTPSSAFAAELAAAITVVLASAMALPVSTTYTLVGGVLGVGLASGLSAINLRVVATILVFWIVTLPAGAILCIIFFYGFKSVFG